MTILHGVQISMDTYNNAAFTTMDAGKVLDPRPSLDHRPRQLQKKRSFIAALPLYEGSEGSYVNDRRSSFGLGDGAKARTGSLRNAVRRIFGRRSREGDAHQAPPLLYSPIYPENGALGFVHPEHQRAGSSPQINVVPRTQSTSALVLPQSDLQQTHIPYGFPHSARLKPLDLGSPFPAPNPPLNRRKSMPSLLVGEADAAALRAEIEAAAVVAISPDTLRVVEQSIGARKHEKRRSRSANDLRHNQMPGELSPQMHKEEMRRWRESLGAGVLRTSGLTARSSLRPTSHEEPDEPEMPASATSSPLRPRLDTPAFQRDLSEKDPGSASAGGATISRDLEDRVCRLEAGLQSFRGQLAQLSADRNRRTILIGSPASAESGTSTIHRSASMLAADLRVDLGPSNYQYEYSHAISPASPSRPPRTPTRTDTASVTPNFSIRDRNMQDPFTSPRRRAPSPPPDTDIDANPGRSNNPTIPTDYTFRSLYEMLTDERSARRRLETQLNALRAEIATLHSQMAFQSNVQQSQRSSYYYAPTSGTANAMMGSNRLHALLQETDISPPSTADSMQPQQHRDCGQFTSAGREDLMSRFSGSESETGGERDSVQSRYELFQTPVEAQSRWAWGSVVPRSSGEAEMF